MKTLPFQLKEKKTRSQLEYRELIEPNSIKCKIFGHYWKVYENRIDLNTHEFTDSLENSVLVSIVKTCKTCNGTTHEFFPFEKSIPPNLHHFQGFVDVDYYDFIKNNNRNLSWGKYWFEQRLQDQKEHENQTYDGFEE